MAEALNRTERDFLLNCGICGGRFTDPRILDCLHSFCKECLVIKQEQATKKDVVICELCGTHTRLPSDSIDSLTTNIFVTNIGRVEEITNSNCSFYCTFCEGQGDWEEASSRCLTCGDWLCLACAGRHCGTTVTKRHKVVTLDDVRVDPQHRPELRKLYESKCISHDEKLRKFCSKCETPVCSECEHSDHKKHTFIPLEDVVEEVRDNLSNALEMYKVLEECDGESDMQMAKRFQEVTNKEKTLLQIVHSARERLIQEIQQQATAAELAISQPFEAVKMLLSESMELEKKRSESTQKSRLFCEKLQQEGLKGECVHFRDLLQRVKKGDRKRAQLEFPPMPEINVNVNELSFPTIFSVSVSEQRPVSQLEIPRVKSAVVMTGSVNERLQENLYTRQRGNNAERIPTPEARGDKPKTDFPESGAAGTDHQSHPQEVEFKGCEEVEDSDVEETEDDDDADNNANRRPFNVPVVPRKSEKTVDDEGIIATLNVNDFQIISLSTIHDKNSPEIFDIAWLTDTEFAVGDKANQTIKVFQDGGEFLWQKYIQEGLIDRIACVDGVVASDFPSGVHLDMRNESFTKIYYQSTTNRTNPYPIAKTIGKEVIIGNADFPELRCYTTKGKRIRYLPLGKKLKINYIALNENKAFFFTEKNSTIVKKFQEGQGISKFFDGLPGWVPEGVATDSENNVYVSDSAGSDIVKLSPQGKLLGILEVHPTSPRGMSISRQNQLLVCDGEGRAWLVHI
ncbi:E3 ubiquitin-protein ligase TRIM56 [Magallana gigas]|uniref:E3 ubiquitin-protein ligase TRIM56 n=1 Tax=Magallana gigas TaxID=29159 RepID=UPI00333FD267